MLTMINNFVLCFLFAFASSVLIASKVLTSREVPFIYSCLVKAINIFTMIVHSNLQYTWPCLFLGHTRDEQDDATQLFADILLLHIVCVLHLAPVASLPVDL